MDKIRLRVKKSNLPKAGKGLFARTDFKKGERITEYKGRLQPWRQLKAVDGYNGYILRVSRTKAINAELYLKTFGRYANDASGIARIKGINNNSEYVVDGDKCYIEAKRNIKKGEEILVAYGSGYWKLIRKLFVNNNKK